MSDDLPNVTLAREMFAMLEKMIADDRSDTWERTRRLREQDDPAVNRWIEEEWSLFRLRVRPMRDQQDYILKQLVELENMKRPVPILVPIT